MKLSNNIKSTIRIAKIELNSMFYSPVAWLVILVFACQIGYSFTEAFDKQLHYQDLGHGLWSITTNMFTGLFGVLSPILRNLYMYVPLITMGLMSREYQTGSIKLLYSSPINNASIILGKFLSMMIYGVALLGILIFITIFCTIFIKDFEYPILLSALLGFYLLILSYSAIGLFMSSITPYQVVAAIGTLALLAILNLIGDIGQGVDFLRDITYWFSISKRSIPFIDGLISSEDIIYYIVVIFFFLSLSVFKLNTEKTIMTLKKKIIGYSAIVLTTIALGYITSRPQMKFYYDATQNKENTLSKESQEIITKVKEQKGNLTIKSYVNILSDGYESGLPERRISDKNRFEQYIRFMPNLKMEYVLYYDKTNKPSFTANRFKGENIKNTAQLICKSSNIDFDKVLSPEEFKNEHMDLTDEGNNFIRKIVAEDGSTGILRLYNDQSKHASEAEISATLNRFVVEAPKVAFYTNNDNRHIDNYGDMGFYLFAHDKWFRNSLVNQGFDTKAIDLDKDDLTGVDIFVISDLQEPLSNVAMDKVQNYIKNGGNIFITGEYQRSENMNKLTEMLGVSFSEGVLVEDNSYINPTIIAAKFTKKSGAEYFDYYKLEKYNYDISANTSVALDYSKALESGFSVIPVLKTTSDSWLEYETTDFIDGEFICNIEANESKAERTILLTMKRNVNGKEQRIVISGDSDIIGNAELTTKHPGMNAQNYSIIKGSFRWLSYDIYAVDVRRDDKTDNKILLPKGSRKYVKSLFMYIIPISLLLFSILIIIKRKRK